MKIVQIITRMDEPGGAQMHVSDISINLKRRGHDISLISGSEIIGFPDFAENDIPYFYVKNLVRDIAPIADVRAYFELKRIISRLKPDLIATHSSKAGLIGRVVGKVLGIPAIFTAHGWAFTEGVPKTRKKMYMCIERCAGRMSSGIITVSHYDHALARDNGIVESGKLVVIQNGVMNEPHFECAKPEIQPPRIVMVARFAQPKNHDAVIRALNRLRHYEWEMVFVGDGPLKEDAERLVKELGLLGRIKFLGSCLNVSSILASSQIFILVSNWEGLPLSILEAMRSGLPVVASDVGGVKEAVVHEHTGFLVPRRDEGNLAYSLEQLIINQDLRTRMGIAALDRYQSRFTLDRMVNETEQFYRKVLDASIKI